VFYAVFIRVLRMPTKIFVGNIALETSRELLMPLFQRYGQVTECDVLGSYGFVVSIILHACCLVGWTYCCVKNLPRQSLRFKPTLVTTIVQVTLKNYNTSYSPLAYSFNPSTSDKYLYHYYYSYGMCID